MRKSLNMLALPSLALKQSIFGYFMKIVENKCSKFPGMIAFFACFLYYFETKDKNQ